MRNCLFSNILTHVLGNAGYLGAIGHRMEVRSVEADSKYASNDDGSFASQPDHHVVYVAVRAVQGSSKLYVEYCQCAIINV